MLFWRGADAVLGGVLIKGVKRDSFVLERDEIEFPNGQLAKILQLIEIN